MKELYATLQQWLFEYLVDQTCIKKPANIHFTFDSDTFSEKADYLTLSFGRFNSITLRPDVQEDDDSRQITETKSTYLTITYVGKNAFMKLSDILDKIRLDDDAHHFLQDNNIAIEPNDVFPLSDMIGDNLLESASLECVLYFTSTRFDNTVNEPIKKIDISKVILN
jgi:hypothetical protein